MQIQLDELPSIDRFKPYDLTGYEVSLAEEKVLAKGRKFVPSVKRVDCSMKEDDFNRFARGMRLAVHHYRKGNFEEEEDEWTAMPWDTKSTFEPKPLNKNLETFLHNVHQDLFSMSNSRYVEDPEKKGRYLMTSGNGTEMQGTHVCFEFRTKEPDLL